MIGWGGGYWRVWYWIVCTFCMHIIIWRGFLVREVWFVRFFYLEVARSPKLLGCVYGCVRGGTDVDWGSVPNCISLPWKGKGAGCEDWVLWESFWCVSTRLAVSVTELSECFVLCCGRLVVPGWSEKLATSVSDVKTHSGSCVEEMCCFFFVPKKLDIFWPINRKYFVIWQHTWLILPVVICLSQRLSHACLRSLGTGSRLFTSNLRKAHYNSYKLSY